MELYTGYCKLCKKHITSEKQWKRHIKSKSHKLKKQKNKQTNRNSKSTKHKLPSCEVCRVKVKKKKRKI